MNRLPQINADRYRVQTALFNLIQNAMEAMPEGGRITVSAQSRSGPAGGVAHGCRTPAAASRRS